MTRALRPWLLAAAMFLSPALAAAATPTEIGRFDDWTAYTLDDPSGKICYIVSEPTQQRGDYTRRGDPYALVTNRPAANIAGEVSLVAGYPFRPDSTPTAEIGNQRFRFYADGDTAWVLREEEKGLLDAMRRGMTMTVRGTSARGTDTTDTYSLRGITAALKAIDGECR